MKNVKILKRIFLVIIFWLSISSLLFSQDIQIKGKIIDATNNELLPGVTIQIKGTSKGTVSAIDGTYSISCSQGAVLVFSYLGYKGQEISINQPQEINISLSPEVTGLDEVVVIGYGTVKKSDATGSVSVTGSKDFNKGAISSPQDLLVGKSSGVVITTNSGAPGSGAQIRIRGGSSLSSINDPLVVVDGIPLDNNPTSGSDNLLNGINPNDIETFTVLKDASATAIYGSRASNGVIIITTKKGNKGFRVEYNVMGSVYVLPNKISVLSGDDFRQLIDQKFPGDQYADRRALLGNSNTDWQSQIFKSSMGQDHNLSFSGMATAKLPYRVSLGYDDQNGILINTGNKKTTASINLNPSLFDDHLKIEINLKGMIENTNWGEQKAIGNAITYDPTQPVKSTDTSYSRYGGYFTWLSGSPKTPISIAPANPVAIATMTDNKSTINRSIGNIQLDYKLHFLPDLRAVLNMGYDYLNSSGHNNDPTNAPWIFPTGTGQINKYFTSKKNDVLDFYLNYVKNLEGINSKIDATAGYSFQHFWEKDSSMNTRIVPASNDTTSTYYISELYLISFFGRFNYSLSDKYLFTFTIRNDRTSKYSPDTNSAIFPSAAFSWKMNNEEFFKNMAIFSNLKLRLSYGLTGQQQINKSQFVQLPDYIYMPLYTTSRDGAYYQFGNTFYPTLRPGAYDAKIKWEETQTYNIGLDYGFLKDRITGSIDYYDRKTNNLLNYTIVPAGSNFSNYVFTNVGNLTNKGLEFTIDAKIISSQDWLWQLGYNLGYNENKITKLTSSSDASFQGNLTGNTISGGVGNQVQINSVGYPANSFFVYQQVYNSKGMPIEGQYVNRSGINGAVTGSTASMYRYKSPAPVALMGISSRLSYKNFEFSFSGRVSLGNYVYNNVASSSGNYYNLYTSAGYLSNVISAVNKTKFETPQYFSDYYVENASFFRMDNIRIGYNFNNLLNNKLNLHVSATVQNAFVITKYTGLDPEINNGIDNNIYPRPRIFNLGISADF